MDTDDYGYFYPNNTTWVSGEAGRHAGWYSPKKFLKASPKIKLQRALGYNDIQDGGIDLTFTQLMNNADTWANYTLKESFPK